ncbi:MAG TPA: CPBP family intramembrane glutamic endopeptidase [Candidatus Acidoferrum sp.]|nr:CPBP family intramembrane glutamic endopeptidase [Candidatus Acidoferrum sp.]
MDFPAAPNQPAEEANQPGQLERPRVSLGHPFFYNDLGIRSGWRLLLYFSLGLLIYGVELVPVSFFYLGRNPLGVWTIILGESMTFAAAFGAALLMARLEDRRSGVYGLPSASAFGKSFGQGILFGLCEISLIVGFMWLLGSYSFGALSFHGWKIIQWGALWFLAAVLIALPEEFLFRGYTQYTLADGIGFWPAAIILSLVFAAVHKTNPGENWVGVINIFFTGLLWAFTLKRTGSLWLAVGWHAAFDFGESFLYSVPNSGGVFEGHLSNASITHGRTWLTGGSVGPEGSIFAFATLGLGAVVIHFWFPVTETKQASGRLDSSVNQL